MPHSTTRSELCFLLNGKEIRLTNYEPLMTLLDYLRQVALLPGSKEGCAEGDCGACTVVVAVLKEGTVHFASVNACIQFLATLDGKAVFTVEGLKEQIEQTAQKGQAGQVGLHPVQQAMVDQHGSQCGFCTPGFVMSLWDLYLRHEDGSRPDTAEISSQLTGNLCRCTGYRPILQAGHHMFDLPSVKFEREKLAAQLQAIQATSPLHVETVAGNYDAPLSEEQLLSLRRDFPQATLLAGGTDVGLWVTKQLKQLPHVIDISKVAELQSISEHAHHLTIGAGVRLNQAFAAIAQRHPQIAAQWERFASMPIRNAGTLGGNVANGSPIGDSMPWLIALSATVTLASCRGERTLPLEKLYLAYMKKDMQADELVWAITIPNQSATQVFRTYKLSKRHDSDISAVCAAFSLTFNGAVIDTARVAYGGMAATPARAPRTEATLIGQQWTEDTAQRAMAALAEDYAPLSDMRASSNYRMLGAKNLLYRFYLETRPQAPLTAAEVNVFAAEWQASPMKSEV